MPVHRDLIVALAAVACGGFVLAAEPATIAMLRRLAAIDAPNTRSSHSVPTPRGGGVPIAIGLVLAAVVVGSTVMLAFSAVVAVFAAIGFADDLASLPAARRLAMQGIASLAAGWVLGRLAGMPPVVALSAAIGPTVLLMGYVHAFNFIDGVN